MSIHNIFDKIKHFFSIDKLTFVYLLIIIGVGIVSFALGRLSLPDNYNQKDNLATVESSGILFNNNAREKENLTNQTSSVEKRYVASKNGKKYYPLGCNGAKRIKKENEVWFKTAEEAEKSGYTKSSTCK